MRIRFFFKGEFWAKLYLKILDMLDNPNKVFLYLEYYSLYMYSYSSILNIGFLTITSIQLSENGSLSF
jgi:hypothetical protein